VILVQDRESREFESVRSVAHFTVDSGNFQGYACVCVCVYVYERERRDRERRMMNVAEKKRSIKNAEKNTD
jgi:hypothetical protein